MERKGRDERKETGKGKRERRTEEGGKREMERGKNSNIAAKRLVVHLKAREQAGPSQEKNPIHQWQDGGGWKGDVHHTIHYGEDETTMMVEMMMVIIMMEWKDTMMVVEQK